jgi:choline-glycine betaine transporter
MTWAYMATQQVWVFFLIYLYFSKYADIKLGECQPDYSDLSWFSMLFSAGVAVGLTFYGVAEPVWH